MKVAFVFSGLIRDLDTTSEVLIRKINELGADVFASFWDIEKDNDTVSNFVKLFKPKRIEVESWLDFEKSTLKYHQDEIKFVDDLHLNFYDLITSARAHAMWYRIWRGNLLTKCNDYDVVVRLRTDLILSDKFNVEINDYLNFPHGGCQITHWKGCYGPHDLIFYGKPELMDYATMVYQYIPKYISQDQYYFPSENLLRHHLSLKDINIRFYGDSVWLRDGGNSKRNEPDLEDEFVNTSEWIFDTDPQYSFKRN